MKIVHTGDWHIGVEIHGKDRLDEQKETLQEIQNFVLENQVDLLLVAGDVFENRKPSVPSEEIVYNFFHALLQKNVAVVVIAGNHDNQERFHAMANLVSLAGLKVFGIAPKKEENPILLIPAKDGTLAEILPLPYIHENYFRNFTKPDHVVSAEEYSQGIKEILETQCKNFGSNLRIILAHLMMKGVKIGDAPLYIGDTCSVQPEHIPCNVDYVALGHIHQHQRVEAKVPIFYCGSPLQMDFGEREETKGFLFLEAKPQQPCIPKFIPFKTGKKLIKITGHVDDIKKKLEQQSKSNQVSKVHIKVTLDKNSAASAIYEIKKNFSHVVDIQKENITATNFSPTPPLPQCPDNIFELYQRFYMERKQKILSPLVIEEFKKLYQASLNQ
jgi:exonuclease SbcD